MQALLQAIISGILVGSSYSLVAMGMVILYRSSGIFNFAHGAVMLLGAFIFWTFISLAGLPLWACIIATIIAMTLIGFFVERFAMRPLLGQPIIASLMMTLAVSVLFSGVYQVLWGHRGIVSYPQFMPMGHWVINGIVIGQANTWILFVTILYFIFFKFYFKFTLSGKQMQAICESHVIAQSVGIDVKRMLSRVWIIACLSAALAGILIGASGSVGLYLHDFVFMVIPVIILGGLESLEGSFVAGFIVGVVEMVSANYIDPIIGGGFRQVAPYVLLLIVLLAKPYGLFGWERIERI